MNLHDERTKPCTRCGATKPLGEFHRTKRTKDGHHPECKTCKLDYQRRYQIANRTKVQASQRDWYQRNKSGIRVSARRNHLWRSYRIHPDSWLNLLQFQGNRCAICGAGEPGGHDQWHTDHDHDCCPTSANSCGRCIRGLLCGDCNLELGVIERAHRRGLTPIAGAFGRYVAKPPMLQLTTVVEQATVLVGGRAA